MQILNVCCRCMVLHKFFDDNPHKASVSQNDVQAIAHIV